MAFKSHVRGWAGPVLAGVAGLFLFVSDSGIAQDAAKGAPGPPSAADSIADAFSKIGDQIYEDCVFDLSQEQVEVQAALIQAYLDKGASGAVARRLAATQIQPPKLSEKCEQIRRTPQPVTSTWEITLSVPQKPSPPKKPVAETKPKAQPKPPRPEVTLANKRVLPQWDCAPEVDYVSIHINGYDRKLTGGEICNPYEDVVRQVPASLQGFRLGYTIATGRLFVIADDAKYNGQTIAWAISGRDICRNNPDPDCLAAKAVGPLPPGEYVFASGKKRINWGPLTKRNVAGIYLKELWNKDRFNPQQIAGIRARGNIAIHVRLKGEMSSACIGLEPKGWAYVSSLIKDMRVTSLNVYIDEPHPQVAEKPPVIAGSSFSLTSLFK